MFQLGRPYLDELGASFLFSGEVLGQRPMSQTRDAILRIDRVAGLEGWILRPLSAGLLAETEPEKRGWVDRSRLLSISGRGRHEQLALAERWGIRAFSSPGGGCLLTDSRFSERLRDLLEHSPEEETSLEDVALLRIGRHVRLAPDLKIVLGRDAAENQRLRDFENPSRWLVEPEDFSGPTALVCGDENDGALGHAAELIARYARSPGMHALLRWRDRGQPRTATLSAIRSQAVSSRISERIAP